jgi:hypothetical protein
MDPTATRRSRIVPPPEKGRVRLLLVPLIAAAFLAAAGLTTGRTYTFTP